MDNVTYGIHGSEFGDVIIARSDKGLCWLGFMVDGYKGDGFTRMQRHLLGCKLTRDDTGTEGLMKNIMAAWKSERLQDIQLDMRGTPFQKTVWEALLYIPAGQVRFYAEVAQAIGQPMAARAVGTAIGENPVSLIVPCHRVVRTDGSLGNYGWGVEVKQKILSREGCPNVKAA